MDEKSISLQKEDKGVRVGKGFFEFIHKIKGGTTKKREHQE